MPLGATMCMNGTAIFEGITVIFLAQIFGVALTIPQMAIVVVMAVVTAIGAAGVPGGSIPLMVGILTMFGVPGEGIAIILGIDRILDMSRTTVNVWTDLTAAAEAGADLVISHSHNRGKGAAVRTGVLAANGRTIAFTSPKRSATSSARHASAPLRT